jgi:serine/threonine protein kinase
MYDCGLVPLFEGNPSIYSWKDKYVFKLRGSKYEMNMAYLAGDCAVQAVGHVLKVAKHIGFIMDMEKSLKDYALFGLTKKDVMEMMINVVKELHLKGIIHGDIKVPNMLLCSDGKVRLCDFTGAFLKEHSKEVVPIYTGHYLSPYRALHPGPLTVEDDLFALGVSIWELFTDKRPFQGLKFGEERMLIKKGAIIDISEIEDDEVRCIVEELMSFMLAKTKEGK